MTPEERFTKIETILARFAEGMDELREGQKGFREAHIELEAAQLSGQKAFTRFVDETRARFNDVGEKLANLTILVDRLVARDLER